MEAVTVFSATGGSIFVGQVILHSVFTPTFLTKENYSFRINLYVIRFSSLGTQRVCVKLLCSGVFYFRDVWNNIYLQTLCFCH